MTAQDCLADDLTVVQRLLHHIDNQTTDTAKATWREPVAHYLSETRLGSELEFAFRRRPVPLCPSAALPLAGSYLAREAAGTPILAVRGSDGKVRAFRNACRHRGMQLASGAGCKKAFVCGYHGWTYGVEGDLRHVPHQEGFPDLDKRSRGLAPLETSERSGIVFVTQRPPEARASHLDALPPLIGSQWRLARTTESEVAANWKVLVEGFLEGYHIRATHPQTFYPVQFDNLNLVETFGCNSRVTFPYRAINKLREVPPAELCVDRKLTYVYHLFPNVIVATFPQRLIVIVLEPLALGRTGFITYELIDREQSEPGTQERSAKGLDLINAGGAEDRAVARAIQCSLASGANEFFEFGLYEGAISHFHRNLTAMLDESADALRQS